MPSNSPSDREPVDESATRSEVAALARAKRRRKLDQVFGEVLPDATSDDRSAESGTDSGGSRDAEIQREIPPHHT